ncbi:MAG: DUF4105 domain-containing protein [Prevotella sp.]|nr:DUF4105 domain-containing protein [Prevotella sp.]
MFIRAYILRSRTALLFVLAALLFPARAVGQGDDGELLVRHFADSDVVERTEISLITCEPFDRVYSLYGHTGLRLRETNGNVDLLANWGIFDMSRRFFILRFTLGLTDYRMDIEDWGWFCYRYVRYGCGIYQQTLNLTYAEKRRLIDLVLENYKPENRYYRYNYFYDNCTTRVRDIIEASVSGEIVYPRRGKRQSWRELIHDWNDTHLWARWGNDYLLGLPADRKTTDKEAQFLPFNLSRDFDGAVVNTAGGETKRLVGRGEWVVPQMYDKGESTFISRFVTSPTGAAMAYLVVFVVVFAAEVRLKKRLWLFDALVLAAVGIMGLLLFVLIFSQHPAVSLNAQILVYNPLALVFLYPAVRSLRRGGHSRCLSALAAMAGIGIVFGLLFQRFSEGTTALALFLIMTYMRRTGVVRDEKR